MRLQIDLSDEQSKLLERSAQSMGISTQELAQAVLSDSLAGNSEDFIKSLNYILNKNTELYERLSK